VAPKFWIKQGGDDVARKAYSEEFKAQTIEYLKANGRNFRLASEQTGVHRRQSQRGATQAEIEAEALSDLRQELIENALILAKSLKAANGSVTFHQRANALNQLIDKIIRLGEKTGDNEENGQIIRFEYEKPEDNPLYRAAQGSGDDYEE
jgi:hypothetical protein